LRYTTSFLLALCLLPGGALADPPHTRAALAARAAALAEDQAEAAYSIRGVEQRTAQASVQLANLEAARSESAQRLVLAEAALAKLLPVMQRLSNAPAATLLAAPLPPGDAVRGVALLQAAAAAIADQAHTVQTENAQLAELIAAAQTSRDKLTQAVATQSQAEATLSEQIATAQTAELAAVDTQAAQAANRLSAQNKLDNLNDAVTNLVPAGPTQANLPAGSGGAPVAGVVVQSYGAPTLAGPATGISYGAAPGAHVTSPCAGTVMFAGPFPSYGLMIITDCGGGDSVVLAGMSELDVAQGEHLAHGQPIGAMQGFNPNDPTHQPRLYIELRQNGTPVDPSAWLGSGRSG